ncbi:vWA domain-containing protein [Gloeothece verrucosa]|uniref:von Willebrand factor type A n=1 Tax=Gloeothece verrucosa (strain PCC 7822) TaxID=497965 RepID=E0UMI2_GLOV7|nr:vWA domain-containing protein [Gloeothece verrucosa]ADN18162.1 von Willebrand factor type A [Gloeothece verrucosa PCC 7822]
MMKKFIVLSTIIDSSIPKLSLSLLMLGTLSLPSWGQVKTVEVVRDPIVEKEEVTLRVKVTDTADKPMIQLQDTDFNLEVVDIENNKTYNDVTFNWKSPEETIPPPAWIIVLLDMSGSMAKEDSRGTTKIEGAIKAIREFTEIAKDRGGNTQVSIVPFGDPGKNCAGYPIDSNTLDNFSRVDDAKLQIFLDNLASLSPCASTNLYEPLSKAVRFLGKKNDSRFYPLDSSGNPIEPQPRLSIILLSDGYHNKPNEAQDFQSLNQLLKKNNQIIVHTLGYGLTAQQLGQKYQLGEPANRSHVNLKKVPEDEFVDEKRLQEIAKVTGGISEFSGDADAIAENLQLFLNALLGEYEISYLQPNPDRGRPYQVSVLVQNIKSQPKKYRITIFGRSLPLKVRLIMLLIIIFILGVGGVIPFYIWGQQLKRQVT